MSQNVKGMDVIDVIWDFCFFGFSKKKKRKTKTSCLLFAELSQTVWQYFCGSQKEELKLFLLSPIFFNELSKKNKTINIQCFFFIFGKTVLSAGISEVLIPKCPILPWLIVFHAHRCFQCSVLSAALLCPLNYFVSTVFVYSSNLELVDSEEVDIVVALMVLEEAEAQQNCAKN